MDIKTYCEYTYSFTYIPIYIYTDKHLSANVQGYSATINPPDIILKQMLANNDPISAYETTIGSYYGQIHLHSQDIFVILGPIAPLKYTESSLQKFFYDYGIPVAEQEGYKNSFASIPSLSLFSFIALLYQMRYAMTNVKSDLSQEEITPYHLEGIPDTAEFVQHSRNNLEEQYHNTLYEVQKITFPMIKNGDLEGLLRYSKNSIPMNFGIFSENLCKQQLVIFIISITNAMIAAIQGGLNQQTALSMAELYIQKGLQLASPADVDALSINAVVEFTKRVREEKQVSSSSIHPSINECIQYICERVYTPITVSEIANYSGYSPDYFSHLFRKETGFTASKFITNRKLYEAKKLLKFTNMTIGEISNQLFFSNQSHFQRAFKNEFQMTPLQFRNSNERI